MEKEAARIAERKAAFLERMRSFADQREAIA